MRRPSPCTRDCATPAPLTSLSLSLSQPPAVYTKRDLGASINFFEAAPAAAGEGAAAEALPPAEPSFTAVSTGGGYQGGAGSASPYQGGYQST